MMNDYHYDYTTPAQDDYSYSRHGGHGPLSPPSTPRPKKQRILHVTPVPLESYLMLPDLDETSFQSHSMFNSRADDFEFRLKPRTVSPPLPSSIMMVVVDQRPGAKEETATTTSIKRPGQFHACPRRASFAHRTSSNRSTSNSSNNSAPTRLVNPSRADSAEW